MPTHKMKSTKNKGRNTYNTERQQEHELAVWLDEQEKAYLNDEMPSNIKKKFEEFIHDDKYKSYFVELKKKKCAEEMREMFRSVYAEDGLVGAALEARVESRIQDPGLIDSLV